MEPSALPNPTCAKLQQHSTARPGQSFFFFFLFLSPRVKTFFAEQTRQKIVVAADTFFSTFAPTTVGSIYIYYVLANKTPPPSTLLFPTHPSRWRLCSCAAQMENILLHQSRLLIPLHSVERPSDNWLGVLIFRWPRPTALATGIFYFRSSSHQ